MATKPTIELVAVKAIQPFVGSYICGLDQADYVTEVAAEDDNGNIIKKRVARKKFAAFIDVERHASVREVEAAIEGSLPPNIEIIGDVPKVSQTKSGEVVPMRVIEHFPPVNVPKDMAADLVRRGLGEIVGG